MAQGPTLCGGRPEAADPPPSPFGDQGHMNNNNTYHISLNLPRSDDRLLATLAASTASAWRA